MDRLDLIRMRWLADWCITLLALPPGGQGALPAAASSRRSWSVRSTLLHDPEVVVSDHRTDRARLQPRRARWLLREERILLTKRQMRDIFFVIETVLPGSVIVVGGGVWWRQR